MDTILRRDMPPINSERVGGGWTGDKDGWETSVLCDDAKRGVITARGISGQLVS